MKYSLNKTNFNDFSFYEINKRPARAYMIPYSDKDALRKTAFRKERYSSDMVRVLSGEWDFKYYSTNKELPDVVDTSKTEFDKIKVPSTWQRTGYDSPAYINFLYPFDSELPNVPSELPVAIYRKKFDIEAKSGNYIIAFLGVTACLDLYVNGRFVGYSEGAHNTAEFDITPLVKKGENEIFAVVHKWSNATFLECQDMWRENGIFRDVLLYEMPKTFVNDIYYKSKETKSGWNLDIKYAVEGSAKGYTVRAELYDGKKIIADGKADADGSIISFKNLNVTSWNAEEPKLYTAFFTLCKGEEEIMTVRNFVGFRTIKIIKDKFTVNGKMIKIKGVNHHDTHPTKGYAMSVNDIEKDIKLMKSFNVNAVRTSHYPPDAQFLVFCDIYGLYVIDENDLETHGCGWAPHNDLNLISQNPAWGPRFLDRVRRMYMRDRSRACIIMWSLGNEAGGYANQDLCYEFLHKENPEIPVHYEGVIWTPRHSYDVVSEMYTKHAALEKCGKHTRGKKYTPKPFFLCEYAHAMGEGPGGLEEYWDIIYRYDNLMGGCIWQWADHIFFDPKAKYKYTYGGDHGEVRHDGNFCVDAVMYPDRRPHTGAKEMKNVYRPVRASWDGKEITFLNTNRFRNASYITAKWKVVKNGSIILCEDESALDIDALASKSFALDFKTPKENCDVHINVYYYDKNDEIAFEQIAVKEKYAVERPSYDGKVTVSEDDKAITVDFGKGKAVFCRKNGNLSSLCIDGVEMINQSPAYAKGLIPNVYSAVTDNEFELENGWKKAGYNYPTLRVKNISCRKSGKNAVVTIDFNVIGRESKKKTAASSITYTVKPGGVIDVNAKFLPVTALTVAKNMPRFGVSLEMPDNFDNVEYYGMGPAENLPDFRAQAVTGIYKTTVEEMYEPYIRPQEYGNRCKTRYVKVTDEHGRGLEFAYKDSWISFNARKYSQKLLDESEHIEDLHSENTTAVEIDGFIRGAGSKRCGPDTLMKYRINGSKGLEFGFTIIPE